VLGIESSKMFKAEMFYLIKCLTIFDSMKIIILAFTLTSLLACDSRENEELRQKLQEKENKIEQLESKIVELEENQNTDAIQNISSANSTKDADKIISTPIYFVFVKFTSEETEPWPSSTGGVIYKDVENIYVTGILELRSLTDDDKAKIKDKIRSRFCNSLRPCNLSNFVLETSFSYKEASEKRENIKYKDEIELFYF
jgi:hypothetical protein